MANRYLTQFPLAFEKRVISVFAKVSFGSSGAPTLSEVDSKGILSCTRNSAGDYTFVFGSSQPTVLDSYVKLLGCKVVFNSGSSAPAAPILQIKANNTASNTAASLEIVLLSDASVATDPASGEIGYFEFTFGDSTAP